MTTSPTLTLEAIVAAVEQGYGLSVSSCDPLELGHDAAARSWRIETPTGSWFLKLRAGTEAPRGALTPAYLGRRGVLGVIAPALTRGGLPYAHVGAFTVIVFPMLEVTQAAETGLPRGGWRRFGEIVRAFHDLPAPPVDRLDLAHETFVPWRRELISPLREVAERGSDDPIMRRFSASWRAHEDEIDTLVAETDARGAAFRTRSHREVVCHTDLHTWNVLVDRDAGLWIVDWDEAMLAPRERDLMFVTGGGLRRGLVSDEDTDAFLEGYGDVDLDGALLDHYRMARAVEDIAAWGEEIALRPGASEAERRESLSFFDLLFEPGDNVDLALAAIR